MSLAQFFFEFVEDENLKAELLATVGGVASEETLEALAEEDDFPETERLKAINRAVFGPALALLETHLPESDAEEGAVSTEDEGGEALFIQSREESGKMGADELVSVLIKDNFIAEEILNLPNIRQVLSSAR